VASPLAVSDDTKFFDLEMMHPQTRLGDDPPWRTAPPPPAGSWWSPCTVFQSFVAAHRSAGSGQFSRSEGRHEIP
jgi:hypothetical protein